MHFPLDVINVADVAMLPMQLMKWTYDDIPYVVCTDVFDGSCAIVGLDALNLDGVQKMLNL